MLGQDNILAHNLLLWEVVYRLSWVSLPSHLWTSALVQWVLNLSQCQNYLEGLLAYTDHWPYSEGSGAKALAFQQAPRWYWCCWSRDRTTLWEPLPLLICTRAFVCLERQEHSRKESGEARLMEDGLDPLPLTMSVPSVVQWRQWYPSFRCQCYVKINRKVPYKL